MFSLPWRLPLQGRDPHQPHRVSTPLELFFDLTFVVAVSANAAGLHHTLSEGHLSGLLAYTMVFFAIWWAWSNYTWFASAYDSGDVLFRVMTFAVMAGVLVLAAGVPLAMASQNFWAIVVGYAIMRLATVPLILRSAHDDPPRRRTQQAYALGIVILQLLWIARTLLVSQGTTGILSFAVMTVAEMALPIYVQRRYGELPWHPHHIAERYGLFTIIVLGEVLLATTQGITAVLNGRGISGDLFMLIVGAFLIVVCAWWFYFNVELGDLLNSSNRAVFNYLHVLIFGSVAAIGAGLEMMVDVVRHEAHIGVGSAEVILAGVLAVYLCSLSFLYDRLGMARRWVVPGPACSALLLLIALLGLAPGLSTLLFGLVMVAGLLIFQVMMPRADPEASAVLPKLHEHS